MFAKNVHRHFICSFTPTEGDCINHSVDEDVPLNVSPEECAAVLLRPGEKTTNLKSKKKEIKQR